MIDAKRIRGVSWNQRRRRLLKSALAKDGFTLAQFAEKVGRTRLHVNYVLRGERDSPWIERCIYELICYSLGPTSGKPFYMPLPKSPSGAAATLGSAVVGVVASACRSTPAERLNSRSSRQPNRGYTYGRD